MTALKNVVKDIDYQIQLVVMIIIRYQEMAVVATVKLKNFGTATEEIRLHQIIVGILGHL